MKFVFLELPCASLYKRERKQSLGVFLFCFFYTKPIFFFSREMEPDAEEESFTCSPQQPTEDVDNQKNSTRASQAGLNSNAIHIPVTITAPPGETTIIPSEHSVLLRREVGKDREVKHICVILAHCVTKFNQKSPHLVISKESNEWVDFFHTYKSSQIS